MTQSCVSHEYETGSQMPPGRAGARAGGLSSCRLPPALAASPCRPLPRQHAHAAVRCVVALVAVVRRSPHLAAPISSAEKEEPAAPKPRLLSLLASMAPVSPPGPPGCLAYASTRLQYPSQSASLLSAIDDTPRNHILFLCSCALGSTILVPMQSPLSHLLDPLPVYPAVVVVGAIALGRSPDNAVSIELPVAVSAWACVSLSHSPTPATSHL